MHFIFYYPCQHLAPRMRNLELEAELWDAGGFMGLHMGLIPSTGPGEGLEIQNCQENSRR